ncbi:MAG: hypothetical protein RBG1_1C00001G0790 [candidate division Zixibacteria bacterium RBG-1]|nr:MAG: hypothetical protein RBG1_1C00001G0790 [candidate division Zixibacteria bacterium RBG-1]OGC83614.1 MAG: hypothetical protein A2V73_06585 [candidate division Zixibacteria bacterium RBG_19FT_COMBO_42_43]
MLDPTTILEGIQTIPALKKIIKIFTRNSLPIISLKHLVVRSDYAIEQILSMDFGRIYEQFKAKRIYLQENSIFKFLKQYYRPHKRINYYSSWDSSPLVNMQKPTVNMLEIPISYNKLIELSQKYDSKVTGLIVDNFAQKAKELLPKEFCKVTYILDSIAECDGGTAGITEIIEFRPIRFVLLYLVNISEKPVRISNYSGTMYHTNEVLEYRKFSSEHGDTFHTDNLPPIILEKGDSLLIPEYVLMAPMEDYLTNNENVVQNDYFNFENYCYKQDEIRDPERYFLIGPSLTVNRISIDQNEEEVHKFDLSNVLSVSEFFECGSCPYIFGYKAGSFHYITDILTKSPDVVNIQNYEDVLIAEIEHETSEIERAILCNGLTEKEVINNRSLSLGDSILIKNTDNSPRFMISGKYFAKKNVPKSDAVLLWKFQNIKRYLHYLNSTGIVR